MKNKAGQTLHEQNENGLFFRNVNLKYFPIISFPVFKNKTVKIPTRIQVVCEDTSEDQPNTWQTHFAWSVSQCVVAARTQDLPVHLPFSFSDEKTAGKKEAPQ